MLHVVRNACTNLFVGGFNHVLSWLGLSYDTNETALRDAFSQHGDIIEVRVICHHVTGKSRGYGFVKFASEDGAASALKEMDGQVLDGRSIRVYQAQKQWSWVSSIHGPESLLPIQMSLVFIELCWWNLPWNYMQTSAGSHVSPFDDLKLLTKQENGVNCVCWQRWQGNTSHWISMLLLRHI